VPVPGTRHEGRDLGAVERATGEVSGALGVHVRGAELAPVSSGGGVAFFLAWGFGSGPWRSSVGPPSCCLPGRTGLP